jgi:hypothetical protein
MQESQGARPDPAHSRIESPEAGNSAPSLTRGPYLGNQTTNSIQIIWVTDIASDSRVDYGTSIAYGATIHDSAGVITHVVSLSNLVADTTYYYRVSSSGYALASAWLHTSHDESNSRFTFAVFGDSGSGDVNQYAVAQRLNLVAPDFVLHTGDVIYNAGEYQNFDPEFFRPYSLTLPYTMFFTSMGNHDYVTLNGQPYLDNFYLPSNSGTERYYSFDYGNAHLTAVDLNQCITTCNPAMQAWLVNDLATTKKLWKFVFFHQAIYSSGAHCGESWILPTRAILAPIFERYNVDIVFQGHDHDYERVTPRRDYVASSRGVTYIVTGGGGKSLYTKNALCLNEPWSAIFWSQFHLTRVNVATCRLGLQAIKPDGTILDTYGINRCQVLIPAVFRNMQ